MSFVMFDAQGAQIYSIDLSWASGFEMFALFVVPLLPMAIAMEIPMPMPLLPLVIWTTSSMVPLVMARPTNVTNITIVLGKIDRGLCLGGQPRA